MKPVLVLTTVGADFNVRAIAHDLVQRRLVACINIVDGLHSIYSWEGRVTEDREQLLIMKTIESRIAELREALFAQHPYEVPEFLVVPIDRIEGPYREWLIDAVR
ncbi:MAG: divalent-cation tolerance protein CutA [Thermoanaerobaculia bacterium]